MTSSGGDLSRSSSNSSNSKVKLYADEDIQVIRQVLLDNSNATEVSIPAKNVFTLPQRLRYEETMALTLASITETIGGKLRVLDIGDLNGSYRINLSALAGFLHVAKNLTSFVLNGDMRAASVEDIEATASALRGLRYLKRIQIHELEYIHPPVPSFDPIARALGSLETLETIGIRSISTFSGDSLMDMVRNSARLKELSLVESGPVTVECFREIFSKQSMKKFTFDEEISWIHAFPEVETNTSLEILDVDGISNEMTRLLLHSLGINTSVQKLNFTLGRSQEEDYGVIIADFLRENTVVQSLHAKVYADEDSLEKNCKEIMSALAGNSLSFTLYPHAYRGNAVLRETYSAPLLSVLQTNCTLEEVAFLEEWTDENIVTWNDEINTFFFLNQCDRKSLLEEPLENREAWVEFLIRCKDNVRATRYALLLNPALCSVY